MAALGPLVIIIDGDTETAHELSHALAALGFDVRGPAKTLAAARELLELVVPDIALISTQLADGGNGLALARELDGRGVRVVMMGDRPSPWSGAYIRKPFAVNSVVDLLASRPGLDIQRNEGVEMTKQPGREVRDWRDWMVPPFLVPIFLAAAALVYGLLRS